MITATRAADWGLVLDELDARGVGRLMVDDFRYADSAFGFEGVGVT
ncbi:hypothetical protein [Streptomyces sp. NPDC058426]